MRLASPQFIFNPGYPFHNNDMLNISIKYSVHEGLKKHVHHATMNFKIFHPGANEANTCGPEHHVVI